MLHPFAISRRSTGLKLAPSHYARFNSRRDVVLPQSRQASHPSTTKHVEPRLKQPALWKRCQACYDCYETALYNRSRAVHLNLGVASSLRA